MSFRAGVGAGCDSVVPGAPTGHHLCRLSPLTTLCPPRRGNQDGEGGAGDGSVPTTPHALWSRVYTSSELPPAMVGAVRAEHVPGEDARDGIGPKHQLPPAAHPSWVAAPLSLAAVRLQSLMPHACEQGAGAAW